MCEWDSQLSALKQLSYNKEQLRATLADDAPPPWLSLPGPMKHPFLI